MLVCPPLSHYRFEHFELIPAHRQVIANGQPVPLGGRAYDLLLALIENRDRVVSKQELLSRVWGNQIVEENNLTVQIAALRKAIGVGAIATVSGRGYRFTETGSTGHTPMPGIGGGPGARPERPSIVVRPFVNISEDARLGILTRGFTEDITTGLARYAQLFVLGRESALAFNEGARDARTVGHAAGVSFVVEGSLRWLRGRLRISAKLIQTEDEAVIWAEQYDGSDDQLFAFQDEIVGRIVAALVESVDRQSHRRSRQNTTENLTAYELFLQGRELRRTHTPAHFPAAELMLERATALDPDFAPAHAELAFLQHFYIGMRVATRSRAELLALGFRHARRAYSLAPDLPFASLAMGALCLRAHDHAEADRWSRRAVRLGPGDAESHIALANVLQFSGRSGEALESIEIADRINPVRPPMHEFNLARALAWTGRFEPALPVAQSCLARAPGFWPCAMVLAVTLGHLGRITEAADVLSAWRAQCGFNAPQEYLDHGETIAGPEFDRMREGLRLAGLAIS